LSSRIEFTARAPETKINHTMLITQSEPQAIELRAHHLLCILGFRGSGYDKKFIANMEGVVKTILQGYTSPLIKVIDECDVICSACPHNKNNECHKDEDSERRVKSRDLKVMHSLGLRRGDEITPQMLWEMIKERLTPVAMLEICHGCEWLELGYCLEGLKRLKYE
jgi:hypothetical protein